MGGNVAEWCSDDFINTDTNVKDNSLKKKYKGGSYYTNPDKCKLNANFGLDPKQRHCGIGFRVVRQVRF
jgi:formylglycine-generating enzyme required for sulfatase activity